jgi:hypothetical protein
VIEKSLTFGNRKVIKINFIFKTSKGIRTRKAEFLLKKGKKGWEVLFGIILK